MGHAVPGVGGQISAMGKEIKNLHKGGKVPKTAEYRLRAGEIVMNKTQQAALAKAKTHKGKMKVINSVKKRRPRKMKGGRRK